MTNEWKTGFEAGALWAASLAAFIANDQQVVSCICRAAGIRLRELQATANDQDATNRIIADLLSAAHPRPHVEGDPMREG